ncbi:uncharacterized protein [Littorina saxatilis]|uniref:DUF3105 domain-containing protein n=1 Tax=Littorina saxatilis TaxID=31220 RepID=A0AAN9AHR0_9CAEN
MTLFNSPSRSVSMALSVTGMMLQLVVVAVVMVCVSGKKGDHGGVAMGVLSPCDDAKTNIEIDWDPQSSAEYTCDSDTLSPSVPKIQSSCMEEPDEGIHVCYPHAINYTDIPPTSGRHRPNWPVYGEYTYVPQQRWLHSLEHGAIVMLYHSCADPQQVETLRNIVTGCLRKHIITPYKLLPEEMPFALLTWGCKLLMSSVTTSVATNFIKSRALQAPEGQVAGDGEYNTSLTVPAQTVSDYKDSVICPGQASNTQTADMAGILSGQHRDSNPLASEPENPIVIQSRKRRQQLDAETEKLDRNVKRLIEAYRRLVSVK